MSTNANTKSTARILNILIRQNKCSVNYEEQGRRTALKTRQGLSLFSSSLVNRMLSDGLVIKLHGNLKITPAGRAKLKRILCDHDPFVGQHSRLKRSNIKSRSQSSQTLKNYAESPLDRLYNRRQKDGTRFLSIEEYEAGERFRSDFEKAQLQPSISADCKQGVSTGNRNYSINGASHISDMAVDARKRLEKAMNAVGPELTGITLDICCFLKGLEIVERERYWPCRSAKLMLKTALSYLARHYGFIMPVKFYANATNSKIGHWGTADYRPKP